MYKNVIQVEDRCHVGVPPSAFIYKHQIHLYMLNRQVQFRLQGKYEGFQEGGQTSIINFSTWD